MWIKNISMGVSLPIEASGGDANERCVLKARSTVFKADLENSTVGEQHVDDMDTDVLCINGQTIKLIDALHCKSGAMLTK